MKKGSKSTKVIQDDPKENTSPNVTPTPTPTPQPSVSQSMVFGKKKTKREYAFNDVVHDEKIFTREVHARVITNENGTYVDVRKYFYGRPSQKGIRMTIDEFKSLCTWANDVFSDIEGK